jgi:hypothetical protein
MYLGRSARDTEYFFTTGTLELEMRLLLTEIATGHVRMLWSGEKIVSIFNEDGHLLCRR